MSKDEEEFEFERKKRSLKEKLFGGSEEHNYLQGIRVKEAKEIEGISSGKPNLSHLSIKDRIAREFREGGTPGTPEYAKWKAREDAMLSVPRYIGSTEAAKWVGVRAKGAAEYIPEKFEKARLDYEAGKISKKAYEEAYRKHKIDAAEARGVGTEQRHYREKIGKEVDRINRAEARKEISISAEKAYALERAKTSARIAAREERKQQYLERQQFVQSRPQGQFISLGTVQPQSYRLRYQVPNPFSPEMAKKLDPLGIYSISKPQQVSQQQTQQFRQQVQQQQFDQQQAIQQMNALLGFSPTDKTGKRRRIYNLFSGKWE